MALVGVHDLRRHFFHERLSWAGQRVQCGSDNFGQGRVGPVLPPKTGKLEITTRPWSVPPREGQSAVLW